jgi:hypothetical protein
MLELICAWKGWLYVSLWKLLFVFLYHWHFGGIWTTFLQTIMLKFNVMNFHHLFYKTCMIMSPQSLEVPKIKIRKTFFSYFYFYFWNFKWLWRVKRLSFKKVSFSSGVVHRPCGSCCSYVFTCFILINCRLVRSKLFVYNKRSGSAGVRHSIFYAFSVGVMKQANDPDDESNLYTLKFREKFL